MIAIVDYGLGNLKSVKYALDRLGEASALTSDVSAIAAADGVILPGVGAFEAAMVNLRELGLVTALQEVARSGRPLLGICLGVQLLFDQSEEHGLHEGLKIIPGQVIRFPQELTVPQMGWNQVEQAAGAPLFAGIRDGAYFYFAHSYYCRPSDDHAAIGKTEYGFKYASAVQQGNVLGTQFHPEKSGPVGLKMLENFAGLCREGGRRS
jgi:glutamine amidotransferase